MALQLFALLWSRGPSLFGFFETGGGGETHREFHEPEGWAHQPRPSGCFNYQPSAVARRPLSVP